MVYMLNSQWDGMCHRCGKCCTLSNGKPCEHLHKAGKVTRCDLYPNQVGTVLSTGQVCMPITCAPPIPGCAYEQIITEMRAHA
jgi:uncharacterized cysteine cluster protein YcgN (CxxCxxCC family)